MKLRDKTLFRQQCYVNGQWIDAADGATLSVENPATGQAIGSVPKLTRQQVADTIAKARAAWDGWRALTANQRCALIRKWGELIDANVDDLAMILTTEQGKPLAESKGEIALGNSYVPWYAEEGRRIYGDVIPPQRAGVRPYTIRQPIGVVAAITPWNFPMSMITRKAAPALAAGCTVILKPASLTPYSALALAELAARAGIPAGVFNVITGSSGVIGGELTSNPDVRKLTFTGSTEVGQTLMAESARTVKKVSLELGGNAPFIVFPDADMDITLRCAMGSKFRNAGQTCICADRFLVHEKVHDAFVQGLAEQVKKIKLGNGVEPGVEQGPLIDADALEHMKTLLDDAKAKGAKVICGGKQPALGGLFFEPTVLTGVTPEMRAWHEEVFGPIAAIMPFSEEKKAIELANDTRYGLAAYFFTRDAGTIVRVSEALEFGIVGVNEAALAAAEVPFGGVKYSGMGREGGREGMDDFLETKYVLLSGLGL